jgi:hypothetical protein
MYRSSGGYKNYTSNGMANKMYLSIFLITHTVLNLLVRASERAPRSRYDDASS